MIKKLAIEGLRGYSRKQEVSFGLPNDRPGSGLNVIVGPNNSGKSTIVEAINVFNGECSFSEGKRNALAKNGVRIELTDESDLLYFVQSERPNGSEAFRSPNLNNKALSKILILPSRRFVHHEFGKIVGKRDSYISNNRFGNRKAELSAFEIRLFEMLKHRTEINLIMSKILGEPIDWDIDQHDNGQYYVKFRFGDISHSSEGIGDGLWSILTICDALYDSGEKQTIVIDEPELSLHPLYQQNVMRLLVEESKHKQIIICTHSPYFIDWEAISNGASLTRTNKEPDGSISIYQISEDFRRNVRGFLNNLNNPHTLGLEANEIFFAPDNVIVVEGQEDVVALRKLSKELSIDLKGHLFGWGAGGASNEGIFLKLLSDLGYKRVVSIFDGDKEQEYESCQKKYPNYKFIILPTTDIRDKKARYSEKKEGLLTEQMSVKEQYKDKCRDLIESINCAFE